MYANVCSKNGNLLMDLNYFQQLPVNNGMRDAGRGLRDAGCGYAVARVADRGCTDCGLRLRGSREYENVWIKV